MTIKVRNIHQARHGSDSQMYDLKGNFRDHEFDQLFDTFDKDKDGHLTFFELFQMTERFRYILLILITIFFFFFVGKSLPVVSSPLPFLGS